MCGVPAKAVFTHLLQVPNLERLYILTPPWEYAPGGGIEAMDFGRILETARPWLKKVAADRGSMVDAIRILRIYFQGDLSDAENEVFHGKLLEHFEAERTRTASRGFRGGKP